MVLPQQVEPWGVLKEVEAGGVVWAGVLGLEGCMRAGSRSSVVSASEVLRIVEETEAVKCMHNFCWFADI